MITISVYTLLGLAAALSYLFHKLTLWGAIAGWLISIVIFAGTGYSGITLLAVFFILATLSTQAKGERRTAGQVFANGGMAGIMGFTCIIFPLHFNLIQLMLAGSLAAATADTLSSELGTKYGSRFINILTLKKDREGLDGVVSLEGTLIGVAGATAIALVYCFSNGWAPVIILAGFTGNIIDSVLGATLERKRIIGNNIVNFLNTATGAFICLLLSR